MYQIFCDLDQTIGDFNFRFEEFSGGISCEDYEKTHGTKGFWKLITKQGAEFWSEIKWMPQGKELWNYISPHTPIILAAPSSHHSSVLGKQLWMEKHLPGVQMILY